MVRAELISSTTIFVELCNDLLAIDCRGLENKTLFSSKTLCFGRVIALLGYFVAPPGAEGRNAEAEVWDTKNLRFIGEYCLY